MITSFDNVLHWQQHYGEKISSANNFDVIECQTCGFKHVIPLPTTDDLITVYRHDYYDQEKPLYLARYEQDLPWWNKVYEQRYKILERHLRDTRRSILDIGSGPGYFLLKGQELGWHTCGIEPSEQAARHSQALGLNVFNGFFTPETANIFGRVDVINLSLVLEHIPDPASLLALVHNQLNYNGLLCVIVPNDFNPFQQILSRYVGMPEWWVAPPHHLNYFDFSSLKQLLARCDFEVIHQETTFPIDLFLMMGDNYVGNDELGRACHIKRMRFEQNLISGGNEQLLSDLYTSLSKLGIGREVVLYARRKSN